MTKAKTKPPTLPMKDRVPLICQAMETLGRPATTYEICQRIEDLSISGVLATILLMERHGQAVRAGQTGQGAQLWRLVR